MKPTGLPLLWSVGKLGVGFCLALKHTSIQSRQVVLRPNMSYRVHHVVGNLHNESRWCWAVMASLVSVALLLRMWPPQVSDQSRKQLVGGFLTELVVIELGTSGALSHTWHTSAGSGAGRLQVWTARVCRKCFFVLFVCPHFRADEWTCDCVYVTARGWWWMLPQGCYQGKSAGGVTHGTLTTPGL